MKEHIERSELTIFLCDFKMYQMNWVQLGGKVQYTLW